MQCIEWGGSKSALSEARVPNMILQKTVIHTCGVVSIAHN
jgi:hypothetical protein